MDASRRPAQIDDIPVGNGPGSGLENVFSGKAAAKDSLVRALGEALGKGAKQPPSAESASQLKSQASSSPRIERNLSFGLAPSVAAKPFALAPPAAKLRFKTA